MMVYGSARGPISKTTIRRTHILAFGLAMLAISFCLGERASYAGSRAESIYYPAFGQAGDVVVAKNGDLLVSLSGAETGIQVFSPSRDFANPCGGTNIIGFDAPIVSAFGLALFPDRLFQRRNTTQSIGVAVEQSGAAFLLADLSTCAKEGIIVAQKPVDQNCMDCSPGSFALAVTRSRWNGFAFVANEFGATEVPSINKKENLGGTVGIIRTYRDISGKFERRTRRIPQNAYIFIPGAEIIPGVTMSHDGNRLYVTNEAAISERYPHGSRYADNPYHNPTGIRNEDLATDSCRNEFGKNKNLSNNGVLTIIDVDRAKRGLGQRSIIQTIAAGCSPVRVVETADGQHIFVATRGGNPGDPDSSASPAPGSRGRIVVFDVSKLLSRDLKTANEALVRVIKDSGGTAPVGMTLFQNDQQLAVANSNRFTKGTTGKTTVAIFDVSDLKTVERPEVICPSSNIFDFPRGVTSGGTRVYVANFGRSSKNVPGSLQVITTFEDSNSSCTVMPIPAAQN